VVEAIVMVKDPGQEHWRGLGRHEFITLPRVGERIDFDIEGTEYSYQVVAVHHTLDPASSAGDIYAIRLGTVAEVVQRLLEEY
jgi:hypothetical protein